MLGSWLLRSRYPKAEAIAVDLLPVEDRFVFVFPASEKAERSSLSFELKLRLTSTLSFFLRAVMFLQ